MNRKTLRFLGMQHDRLAAEGGPQAERDELLAKLDAIATDLSIEPRVGEVVKILRKTRDREFTFEARVLNVTPGDGFVFVSWIADDGRFGHLEHGRADAYGDRLVA